jgi:hypothetical protein
MLGAANHTDLSSLAGVARVETRVATFVHGKAVPNSTDPTLARPTAQRLSVVSAADPRSNAAKAGRYWMAGGLAHPMASPMKAEVSFSR